MKERYYSIDIYKLIAALLIVSVHTVLFWNYEEGTAQWYAAWMLMAVARNGVPLFFMASAFLLYSHQEDRSRSQTRRLLTLYSTWCIFTLPFILYTYYHLFSKEGYDFLQLLTYFFKQFFFIGLCGGGWFVLSTIWCIWIVKYLARKSSVLLWGLSLFLYLLSIMDSSYYFLLGQGMLFNEVRTFFGSFCNFIPAALLFFVIGKTFAEHKTWIPIWKKHRTKLYVATLLAIGMNVIELGWCIQSGYVGSTLRTDSTFSLPLSACLLMATSFTFNLKPRRIYRRLRNCSTMIYFIQFPIIRILFAIGIKSWTAYLLTLVLGFTFSLLIFFLEKKFKQVNVLY